MDGFAKGATLFPNGESQGPKKFSTDVTRRILEAGSEGGGKNSVRASGRDFAHVGLSPKLCAEFFLRPPACRLGDSEDFAPKDGDPNLGVLFIDENNPTPTCDRRLATGEPRLASFRFIIPSLRLRGLPVDGLCASLFSTPIPARFCRWAASLSRGLAARGLDDPERNVIPLEFMLL